MEYVTSDNPITYDGFASGPVLMPLSRNIFLEASREAGLDLAYLPWSMDEARRMCALTISQCTTEVYAPFNDKWVWTVLDHGELPTLGT